MISCAVKYGRSAQRLSAGALGSSSGNGPAERQAHIRRGVCVRGFLRRRRPCAQQQKRCTEYSVCPICFSYADGPNGANAVPCLDRYITGARVARQSCLQVRRTHYRLSRRRRRRERRLTTHRIDPVLRMRTVICADDNYGNGNSSPVSFHCVYFCITDKNRSDVVRRFSQARTLAGACSSNHS